MVKINDFKQINSDDAIVKIKKTIKLSVYHLPNNICVGF